MLVVFPCTWHTASCNIEAHVAFVLVMEMAGSVTRQLLIILLISSYCNMNEFVLLCNLLNRGFLKWERSFHTAMPAQEF